MLMLVVGKISYSTSLLKEKIEKQTRFWSIYPYIQYAEKELQQQSMSGAANGSGGATVIPTAKTKV